MMAQAQSRSVGQRENFFGFLGKAKTFMVTPKKPTKKGLDVPSHLQFSSHAAAAKKAQQLANDTGKTHYVWQGGKQNPMSRRNLFGWFKPKVYSAATKKTYGSHAEATKDRLRLQKEAKEEKRQQRKDLQERRKEHLEDLRYEKERKKLEREIAAADRKIDSAEKKLDAAEAKHDKGGMTEARFEQVKARLQREIEAQERHKAKAQSNPARSAAQYRLAQAVLSGTARSSMPRKVAQEIVDQTPAKLRSEYMRQNACKSSGGTKARNLRGEVSRGSSNPGWKRVKTTYGVYKVKKQGTAWWVISPDGGKYPYETREAAMKSLEKWRKPNPDEYSVFIGNVGWKYDFATLKAARDYAAAHPGRRFDIHKGAKTVETGKTPERRNPAEDASALSEKFHGRPATTQRRVVEPMHVHKHLMEIGPLVRLVVDTPTNKVVVLNFNTSDPKKIVYLSSSEKDPKTGKIVGKQLYLRGGDQEVNLKGLGMDSPLWIRDKMELGRLHEFKRGERLIEDERGGLRIAEPGEKASKDEQEIKGSITYRTRKGMDDFKLVDYWHKAGEETSRQAGAAARPLVLYDYRNKKLEIAGGQYTVDAPGIIN